MMKKIAILMMAAGMVLPLALPGPALASAAETSIWYALSQLVKPTRERVRESHRYDRAYGLTGITDLKYLFYRPQGVKEVVGFSLINKGSRHINPIGMTKPGAFRNFTFSFADRAREDIFLSVNDDVKITRRYSDDNMFRELHFFPRRMIPSIEPVADGRQLKVTLPTGEPVLFDARSKEINGGVLSEEPIDFNRDRHKRRNPEIVYKGRSLVVSVAQRGESARRAKVWGQRKYAEVHYPSKYARACRISPEYIWDQSSRKGGGEPRLTMLHETDHALFEMIEKRCGWNLSALKLEAESGISGLAMQ